MTIPLTVKLNKAMWMGLERINPDARIALRLIAVQRLLDLKLLRIEDVPPGVQEDLPRAKGKGAK
jgi:hypothetical protein